MLNTPSQSVVTASWISVVAKNISLLVDMFKVHLQQGWDSIFLTIAREGSLLHGRRPIVVSMSGFWQPMELTN